MEINRNITNTNRTVRDGRKIEYIVIHYVGAVSSARNNTIYFKEDYRGVSAHYFVDDYSIWQCVEEKDRAWHCGAVIYYNKARNDNSIGVEMCCFMNNGKLDISAKTIANTIELVKDIMKRYNIPIENVVRHYDVTHKKCPAPFVDDAIRWTDFKRRLTDDSVDYLLYTVKKGDSLWKIASTYLGNGSKYTEIATLNNIKNNFIYEGLTLKIPTKNANISEPKVNSNEIKVGSKVILKAGAKTYTGGKLASFVYKRTHIVKEIKNDRAVITYNGVVIAAVKVTDLTIA